MRGNAYPNRLAHFWRSMVKADYMAGTGWIEYLDDIVSIRVVLIFAKFMRGTDSRI